MDTLIVKNLDGEISDVLFSTPIINLRNQNINDSYSTPLKFYTDENTVQIRSSHNVSKAVSQPEFAP